jgi:hypothetical protein
MLRTYVIKVIAEPCDWPASTLSQPGFQLGFFLRHLANLIFLIGIVGGGVQLGPLGAPATNGLLCRQPWVNIMMEKFVE